MNEVICINESFSDWETTERYDVIIMNPPFNKLGEPFIMKCASLLKDGGYLGCVMSQYWRSITTNYENKTYYKLLQQGGFHMIHMYSNKDTADLFNQNIGQVDTFVWQKGTKINNTKVINQRGEVNTISILLSSNLDIVVIQSSFNTLFSNFIIKISFVILRRFF